MTRFAERFARDAVPHLFRHFGAVSEGQYAALSYFATSGGPNQPPLMWFGWQRRINFDDALNDRQELERRETRTWRVLRSDLDRDGVRSFPPGSRFQDSDGEWTIDQSTTSWGNIFVTIGLARKPLVRKDERRSASAV